MNEGKKTNDRELKLMPRRPVQESPGRTGGGKGNTGLGLALHNRAKACLSWDGAMTSNGSYGGGGEELSGSL
jgi:hypothetical protein